MAEGKGKPLAACNPVLDSILSSGQGISSRSKMDGVRHWSVRCAGCILVMRVPGGQPEFHLAGESTQYIPILSVLIIMQFGLDDVGI